MIGRKGFSVVCVLGILFSLLLVPFGCVSAVEVAYFRVSVYDDVYTASVLPDYAYWNGTTVKTHYVSGGSTGYSYFMFNISGVPADKVIRYAYLQLEAVMPFSVHLKVWNTTTGWVGDAVTWNSPPSPSVSILNYSMVSSNFADLDVTSAFNYSYLNGDNCSLRVSTDTYGGSVSFWSLEGMLEKSAQLVVSYYVTSPTATPSDVDVGFDWSPYWWLVTLIVTFVPALGCAVALGKWGFFAGATCGVVMGYVWLGAGFVPVWCVLLVGLADFLMFYQGAKGSV